MQTENIQFSSLTFVVTSIRFRKPFLVLIWLILAMGSVFIILILVILIATGVAVSSDGAVDIRQPSDGDTMVILTSVLTMMLAVVAGESYM